MKTAIYRLDSGAAESLTEQLADNLRRAIANGVCKPGDKLPGIREMAKLCGTSVQVPIGALKILAEEGFVKARPRVGCVVLSPGRKVWRGRILMVHVGAHSNYGQNVFCAEVASLLGAADWRVAHFYVPRRGGAYGDIESLEKVLSEKYELVLLPAYDQPVIRIVQEKGLPYMLLSTQVGESKSPGCIGMTAWSDGRAVADFTKDCLNAGIRHVLNVRFDEHRHSDFVLLREAGVNVEDMFVDADMSDLRAECLSRATYEALLKRMSGKRAKRPDLIVFADDYHARGGLWALAQLGLCAPEDVKVVSLANYGNAPFYPKSLTRFEYNQFDFAAKTVRKILRYLREGTPPGNVFCFIRYVRGETF